MLILGTIFVKLAQGHEDSVWTHLKQSSGPIYGAMPCGYGIKIWYQDMDDDGKWDTCRAAFLNNGNLHVSKFFEPVNGTCSCEDIPKGE
jgi:hypothetical protein